ncbi:MAG: hypothetical protein LV481_03175 [Methylacidiphilales bacterium]|nr:hypothetical protein [Candidatus Methylacidiphilales bacterium]
MKKVALLGCVIIAATVLGPIDISTLERSNREEEIRTNALLAKVSALAADKIQKITITPEQLSTKQFQTEITAKDDIQYVRGLLNRANTQLNDSHNCPIYDCTLTFTTSTGTVRFLASACQYDPNDCYVTDLFYNKLPGNGYIRGNPPTIKIPDLGSWLMQREPKGTR